MYHGLVERLASSRRASSTLDALLARLPHSGVGFELTLPRAWTWMNLWAADVRHMALDVVTFPRTRFAEDVLAEQCNFCGTALSEPSEFAERFALAPWPYEPFGAFAYRIAHVQNDASLDSPLSPCPPGTRLELGHTECLVAYAFAAFADRNENARLKPCPALGGPTITETLLFDELLPAEALLWSLILTDPEGREQALAGYRERLARKATVYNWARNALTWFDARRAWAARNQHEPPALAPTTYRLRRRAFFGLVTQLELYRAIQDDNVNVVVAALEQGEGVDVNNVGVGIDNAIQGENVLELAALRFDAIDTVRALRTMEIFYDYDFLLVISKVMRGANSFDMFRLFAVQDNARHRIDPLVRFTYLPGVASATFLRQAMMMRIDIARRRETVRLLMQLVRPGRTQDALLELLATALEYVNGQIDVDAYNFFFAGNAGNYVLDPLYQDGEALKMAVRAVNILFLTAMLTEANANIGNGALLVYIDPNDVPETSSRMRKIQMHMIIMLLRLGANPQSLPPATREYYNFSIFDEATTAVEFDRLLVAGFVPSQAALPRAFEFSFELGIRAVHARTPNVTERLLLVVELAPTQTASVLAYVRSVAANASKVALARLVVRQRNFELARELIDNFGVVPAENEAMSIGNDARLRTLLLAPTIDARLQVANRPAPLTNVAPHEPPAEAEQAAPLIVGMIIRTNFLESIAILGERGRWFRHRADNNQPPDTGAGFPQQGFLNALEGRVGTLWAGFRVTDALPFAVAHAWNVAGDGTTVIDRTPLAREESAWYYGVHIPIETARELVYSNTPASTDFLDAVRFIEPLKRAQLLASIRDANPLTGVRRSTRRSR